MTSRGRSPRGVAVDFEAAPLDLYVWDREPRAWRKAVTRARRRARALLHRYLTKEQRFELRYTDAFTMRGKDGRTYHLTMKGVRIEHEGVPYVLCLVPEKPLPVYDTLLAQKVLLEIDPEMFLRVAHAENVATKDQYLSADFIFLGHIPEPYRPPPSPLSQRLAELLGIPVERLGDPQAWTEAYVETAFSSV